MVALCFSLSPLTRSTSLYECDCVCMYMRALHISAKTRIQSMSTWTNERARECMYASFRQRCFFIDKIIAHNNALLFRFEIYCFLSFCINHRSQSDILPRNVCMPFTLLTLYIHTYTYSVLAFGRCCVCFFRFLVPIYTSFRGSDCANKFTRYVYMHVFKPSMTLRAEQREKKPHGINEQIKLVHIKMIISFSFCITSLRVAWYIVGLEFYRWTRWIWLEVFLQNLRLVSSMHKYLLQILFISALNRFEFLCISLFRQIKLGEERERMRKRERAKWFRDAGTSSLI